ncbi:unnamed protein product [Sphacelaria rigidula]
MQHNFLGVFAEMCEIARPKIAAEAVMTSACKALGTRKASLFKAVHKPEGLREIACGNSARTGRTVKPGEGIVGRTAFENTGALFVADPKKNEAFSPAVDIPRDRGNSATDLGSCSNEASAGLMCGPVKDGVGGVWGVLVVAGPGGNDGAVGEECMNTFKGLLDIIGIAMRNSEAFSLKERAGDKFHNMLEVIEATSGDLGVNHLLYTIAKCLPVICDAQKCTAFVVDDDKDELWAIQGEVNIRVPKSKGIVGAVATKGESDRGGAANQ